MGSVWIAVAFVVAMSLRSSTILRTCQGRVVRARPTAQRPDLRRGVVCLAAWPSARLNGDVASAVLPMGRSASLGQWAQARIEWIRSACSSCSRRPVWRNSVINRIEQRFPKPPAHPLRDKENGSRRSRRPSSATPRPGQPQKLAAWARRRPCPHADDRPVPWRHRLDGASPHPPTRRDTRLSNGAAASSPRSPTCPRLIEARSVGRDRDRSGSHRGADHRGQAGQRQEGAQGVEFRPPRPQRLPVGG